MAFFIKQNENWYLKDTAIENIFINEYMTQAPGDYAKIYIFAFMYAQMGAEISNEAIAKAMSVEEEDVLKAWNYWESLGAIIKHQSESRGKFDYDVEFLSLKTAAKTGNASLISSKKVSPLEDEELKGLYMLIETILARTLNGTEMKAVQDWLVELETDPEVIVYAYNYCKNKGKDNYRYVGAVVKNWVEAGLKTAEQIETHLARNDERNYLYRRVFKALGFDRNWTEKEQALMDTWFDNMEFTIDRVLEACGKSSGISNPNLNYVNKVLVSWHEQSKEFSGTSAQDAGKKISMSKVLKYYEYIRTKEEKEAAERKKEIYSKIPRINQIDNRLKKCSMAISKAMIGLGSSDKDEEISRLRAEADALTTEKAFLLTDNNYRYDYMDIDYKCDLCKDTGITESGERCQCFSQRMEEAVKWQSHQK